MKSPYKTLCAAALGLALCSVIVGAHAADLRSNNEATANSSGYGYAGNEGVQVRNEFNTNQERDTRVKTNPSIGGVGLSTAFTPFNCANSAGGGFSGGYIAIMGGGPVESDNCNGRADATMLMQMARAARESQQGTLALDLERAARNLLCMQQIDATYAALANSGLCDTVDLDGFKAQRRAGVAPADQLPGVRRTAARNNFDNLYPATGN